MILLNNEQIPFIQFPNGETKVDGQFISQNIVGEKYIYVTLKYENDSDLIKLLFVKKFLDSHYDKCIRLLITYMPYSRMDRVEGNSVFTLKYIADFINSMNFQEVTIFEPHSDVCVALINNCKIKYPSVEIFNHVIKIIGFDKYHDYVYFPDVGAEKRYSKKIGNGFNSLIGLKTRDFETGEITGLKVIGNVHHNSFKAVIIDDLSSYGTTFIKGAEKLKELGASEIHLVLGNCENSILKGEIFKTDLITGVYTTNGLFTDREQAILIDKLHIRNI